MEIPNAILDKEMYRGEIRMGDTFRPRRRAQGWNTAPFVFAVGPDDLIYLRYTGNDEGYHESVTELDLRTKYQLVKRNDHPKARLVAPAI